MNEVRAVAGTTPLKAVQKALFEYIVLYSSLLVLALICLAWSIVTLPLYFLLPRSTAKRVGRYGIMAGFRLYGQWLTLVGAFEFDLSEIDALRGGPALILAPNHPSLIDAILILTRHPNLACVMKSNLMDNVLFGPGARLARYINNSSTLRMVRDAVTDLNEGGTLLLFPEGTRSERSPVGELKKSIAVIARQAQVPVQTVIIDMDSPFLSKARGLWARPSFPVSYRVRLGKRFDPPQDAPQDVDAFMAELERHYRAELHGSWVAQWLGRSTCL
jgi:1-acyl-sn-glycerol-3-phosphate acyltransferase